MGALIPQIVQSGKTGSRAAEGRIMAEPLLFEDFNEERRRNWIRLRTLIMLRWIAVVGQGIAIAIGTVFYRLQLEIGLCGLVIGAAVIANIVAIAIYPENKRLSEREAVSMLLFDSAQLTAMLYLTGGLHNPFALLILTPVTISATALRPQSTLLLGAVAIGLISLVAVYYLPLITEMGIVLSVPRVFVFGSWAAIVIGVTFLGAYAWRVTSEIHSMSEAYLATQMALAREQKLTDLGGVVAAAAHELGTPLATIKLVSSELMDELAGNPEAQEDARLINEQADRCRDILRSMGRAGKDDLLVRQAPLEAVIREAADPHVTRGKLVHFEADPDVPSPNILRRPEIIHGLRNLVQNAVDFAAENVWVETDLSDGRVTIRIVDDGPGYSASMIGRLGDPFVRRRAHPPSGDPARPGYEGMGLGLFIAKTLLERTGAEILFSNASDPADTREHRGRRAGAIIEVTWPRDALERPVTEGRALGENQPILA